MIIRKIVLKSGTPLWVCRIKIGGLPVEFASRVSRRDAMMLALICAGVGDG